MKISKIKDYNVLIQDALDLSQYPDIYDKIIKESNILSGNRGGRKMCRMTDPGMKYTLGGRAYSKKNYTPTVKKIAQDIAKIMQLDKDYFNTCTLNYYPNGRSGFRAHTDYMRDLEQPMIIATLTLGNSNRIMNLYDRKTSMKYEIPLENNSVLVMGPYMQRTWLHEIPKDKTKEPRLSLSFRRQAKTGNTSKSKKSKSKKLF